MDEMEWFSGQSIRNIGFSALDRGNLLPFKECQEREVISRSWLFSMSRGTLRHPMLRATIALMARNQFSYILSLAPDGLHVDYGSV